MNTVYFIFIAMLSSTAMCADRELAVIRENSPDSFVLVAEDGSTSPKAGAMSLAEIEEYVTHLEDMTISKIVFYHEGQIAIVIHCVNDVFDLHFFDSFHAKLQSMNSLERIILVFDFAKFNTPLEGWADDCYRLCVLLESLPTGVPISLKIINADNVENLEKILKIISGPGVNIADIDLKLPDSHPQKASLMHSFNHLLRQYIPSFTPLYEIQRTITNIVQRSYRETLQLLPDIKKFAHNAIKG